ncbi:hypothetical protein [Pseudoruegeria sp. SK021]|uniref:hypothetical protein n=1 Tax=Pseudoruegeria sp. SK021 TaxID=1933035 RepID=UPI000A25BA2E|nr:hypothetical protein [Pseudoruegeria sp. SK021]OSP54384.1 hypothetical protein BV911_12965 [Pseudoruegeria sp. SK021]
MTNLNNQSDQGAPLPTAGPAAADVRAQLDRILNSAALSGSQRRRDLLRYLVEETLAGRGHQIKGYSVALAVLGRDESFDPASDPVVRLEAGRLRRSLDTYYVDVGMQDPVRITIPKGAYVADFVWWMPETTAEPKDPSPTPVPAPLADPAPRTEPPTAPVQDLPEPAPPPARIWRKPSTRIAALTLILGLGLATVTWLSLREDPPTLAEPHGSAIIVLPFEKLDGSDDTKLLANAITQDLIYDLMRSPDFRLYSAQDSFGQDPDADPVTLGRNIGVAFVLRGSIHTGPSRVRLVAQLVDATSGSIVWSGSYDRVPSPNDLFKLRSDLSSTVATVLGETFGVVNEATFDRLSKMGTPSLDSYFCVLRGYEYRRTFEDVLYEPARACLLDAVANDPDYADAWAMLGWIELDAVRQEMVPPADNPARMRAAYASAERALKLDPNNIRGLSALSAITFSTGEFAQSEQFQRRALALNPNDPATLAQLGWQLSVRGNWDDGIPLLTRAIDRSANPPGWYFHLIAVHAYLNGNYAGALAAADRSAKFGSAIGLALAAISHAKLGDNTAASDAFAAMAQAWPLLARDPAATLQKFHPTDQIVTAIVEGLQQVGGVEP